ncbi:hypothetical protein IQ247_16330 [Plectonema cf. radiosum LEGE 06105]|uniref:Uncharacterized protein n=1 Tax=Plectonema cf. radiosum LEGE 06105 TaxID=945769 RepID=A0A8J7F3H6_9CYAN|nr:hypothetical protein [Plectonema radiosum]MBE9214215.1 hypothetical protein [Plectonema cf. radiosum LEGE 06105]
MSRSRFASPRLRYLKARLSVLTRPSFLIAAVFLAGMGFVIREYWTNPDFLKFAQNQTASSPTSSNQSSLSEEDRAIAADIDNLSILDYDQKKAEIPIITNFPDSNKLKKQNEEQLSKILELSKKNETTNEIKSNTTSESNNTNNSLTSSQNPFISQAENLLKFNFRSKEEGGNTNNLTNSLSPFASGLQTPQSSLNLGINSGNSANQNQNGVSESALKAAINQSNNQSKENSTTTSINTSNNPSTNTNNFGQLPLNNNSSTVPTSSLNQQLRQSETTPLVDTTIFNQPLNNQQQNPYSNFNQSGLNNQIQNPNNNFYNQQNFNNQLPVTNYNQPNPNFNNQLPVTNFNNPTLNNPTFNNQIQNPYNNFNNNQLPTNNYNQSNFNNQSLNNQIQNPYNNFNNTPITGNRYNPEIQQRVNNIYNRLTNRDNPTVNPNTYNLPINNGNTNFQQPNIQQFNSPYSTQTPLQYPNSGY